MSELGERYLPRTIGYALSWPLNVLLTHVSCIDSCNCCCCCWLMRDSGRMYGAARTRLSVAIHQLFASVISSLPLNRKLPRPHANTLGIQLTACRLVTPLIYTSFWRTATLASSHIRFRVKHSSWLGTVSFFQNKRNDIGNLEPMVCAFSCWMHTYASLYSRHYMISTFRPCCK